MGCFKLLVPWLRHRKFSMSLVQGPDTNHAVSKKVHAPLHILIINGLLTSWIFLGPHLPSETAAVFDS